jgi:hypothetical protein
MTSGETVIGNALRDTDGRWWLGVAVPIMDTSSTVVAVLLLENQRRPIGELVKTCEVLVLAGETLEQNGWGLDVKLGGTRAPRFSHDAEQS